MDPGPIENVLRLIDREVWIVTSIGRTDEKQPQRGGLVATWVSQSSIDRLHPSVVIGIAANHFTSNLIDESSCFGLHLLRPNQTSVAFDFALGSGRDRDKCAGHETHDEATGSPILTDCLAWLDCEVYHRFSGGDRNYYFADVVAGNIGSSDGPATRPLTESQLVAAATTDQLTQLRESITDDVRIQRPLYREWREQLSDSPHPRNA